MAAVHHRTACACSPYDIRPTLSRSLAGGDNGQMTTSAGPGDGVRDGAAPAAANCAASSDDELARPVVRRPREELTREERQFLERFSQDRPPHHDSSWG